MNIDEETARILADLGVRREQFEGGGLETRTPIDGRVIGRVPVTSGEEARQSITQAHEAFLAWRTVPAPRRGELVRLLGEELRSAKTLLGQVGHD